MTPTRGAYGFRLEYRDHEESTEDLLPLDGSLPLVTVAWRHATAARDVEVVSDRKVTFGARGASTIEVERDPPSVLFDLPEPPVPGALVHPLLTVGISVLARWRGDVTLHAGAFETRAGAWGIVGAREAGKSAILAGMATHGHPIVADDLLAIQEGAAWAGPTCVDLRPDTADRFPATRFLGVVAGRPRFRMSTPRGRARLPVRGFFLLEWHGHPGIEVEPLPAEEWLRWLYRQEYIGVMGAPDPRRLLPLLALPCWRVTRPRDWAATRAVVDTILAVTATEEAGG